MISEKIHAITPSASLFYKINIVQTEEYKLNKYVNYDRFSELCKEGCPNYAEKWACPPYSPSYTDFTKQYEKVAVCLLTMDMDQFSYIKNDYLKVRAANTILKSRIDKALRQLKSQNRPYISTGSCRLCKPCRCKSKQPCAHPDIMSYSFESLGMDVSTMVKDLFDIELLWYKKGHVPQYTSAVAGLLSNEPIDETEIIDVLINQH